MEGDAYIRLGSHGPRHWGNADSPTDLVFVDLEQKSIDKLRQVPHDVVRRMGALLVRAEPVPPGGEPAPWAPSLADVRKIAERLDLSCQVGLLHQPIGAEPYIQGDIPAADANDLLARARAVELNALLEWGRAVWRPTAFHYRLPSGEHAKTFVKLVDAIRQPRDAQVVASWLNRHLVDELGLVADTAGLVAVTESLRATMRAAGLREGPVAVLDGYPSTGMAVQQAVKDALGNSGRVLAILSVNSSGRVATRLLEALHAPAGGVQEWTLEILVDRRACDLGNVSVWLPGPGDDSLLGEQYGGGDGCPLCRDGKTTRVVPINPISFDGMLASQIRQLMPSTADARLNRALWETCSESDAIGLVEPPDEDVAAFRPSPTKMPIHFRLRSLLDEPVYGERLADRVEQMLAEQLAAETAGELRAGQRLTGQADLILVPEHEGSLDRHSDLWDKVAPHLAADGHQVLPFSIKHEWSDELRSAIAQANDILVFALGLVTGGSITKALAGVQSVRKDHAYGVSALVVHARPSRKRAWQSLRNAYAHRLFEAWLTYLPERSPMQDELAALDAVDGDDLGAGASDFLDRRKALVSGSAGDTPTPLFWGARADDKLSPHSLYGEGLDPVTTFAALGSSMERARQMADLAVVPELRVFELQALLTSYFDKLILVSILRWLRPAEAWWGDTGEDAQATMQAMFNRADQDDLRILVPELLLAIAQGKVQHEQAVDVVRAHVASLLASTPDDETRAAVEVGLAAIGGRQGF